MDDVEKWCLGPLWLLAQALLPGSGRKTDASVRDCGAVESGAVKVEDRLG
ncbi:hypothetical protein [Lentzea flava]|uniref:Uncharacterized protein n=1 Tax=Lentzea flava TaxID=103732 RepID=A0ABQ2US40_9PSEU|nr:hypothetical protein [Lentzea flava]MCP2201450.1 hypothetical protein [Lentzea flava]GGU50947.1 hypothetical protein GCM10010178_49660 [Lentzea flava]